MRLIDADELVKYFRDKYEPTDVIYFPYVLDDIDAQPTADAVEVVRCKDCVHNKQIECPLSYTSAISDYGTITVYYKNKDDDYCSYGKRKDGAK